MDRLKSLGCQLVGVTRDSILSIGQLPTLFGFPILSDKSLQLAKAFVAGRRSQRRQAPLLRPPKSALQLEV